MNDLIGFFFHAACNFLFPLQQLDKFAQAVGELHAQWTYPHDVVRHLFPDEV